MQYEAAALIDLGKDLDFIEVTCGDLHPNEVLVRMVASGICHTDLTVQRGNFPAPLPIILGHEGSGIIDQVGSDVYDLAPGDPVGLTFMSCGLCASCIDDDTAHCTQFHSLNFSGMRSDGSTAVCCDGRPVGGHFFGQSSFARYSVANRRNVVKIRADAPLEMIGPFGCSIQTGAGAIFNVLRPQAGSSCVVFGAGGVGLSAVMAAKVSGCDPIIVVEPRVNRRVLAGELGATIAIDPATETDIVARLVALTSGGAETIVDTTGMGGIITSAISALGQGGRLGLIGMHDLAAEASFSIVEMLQKRASIHAIIEGDSKPQTFIPYLVDLFVEGRFPVDKLITFFPFRDINSAIAAQASGDAIKPVILF